MECHAGGTDLVPLISLSVHSVIETVAVNVICNFVRLNGTLL